MGIIIRQSIQNTIISYAGVVFGFISTILLYPHILDPDQYGLTRLLLSLAFVSSQFAHLGIKNVVVRYFPYFNDSRSSRESLLTLSLLVPIGGYLLFSLFYLLFSNHLVHYYDNRSALFSDYYLYLLPMVFFMLFSQVLNSYAIALKDSVTGSFLHDIVTRIIVIVLLILHYFRVISFPEFMQYFVLTFAVQPLCLAIYLKVRDELSLRPSFFSEIRRYAKAIGVYSLYSLLGGLSILLVGNIDIIMLGAMTDLANTAVYAIAFYAGSVITVPQRAIGKITSPILARLLKQKKINEIESIYKRTSLNQIIAGSLLLVGIWANMHNLMYLLPPEYHGGEWVIVIIGLSKLFDMATGVNGYIILNSRHYKFDLYTNILLVILTVTTNYLLIPIYGILGAAIATALSIFLYNFTKFVFVWKKFSMQPFNRNTLAVISIAAGCLILSFQIPYLVNFIIDLVVRSLIITILFLGAILTFNLSSDVQHLVEESLHLAKNTFKI